MPPPKNWKQTRSAHLKECLTGMQKQLAKAQAATKKAQENEAKLRTDCERYQRLYDEEQARIAAGGEERFMIEEVA
jgi:hypothetical protein